MSYIVGFHVRRSGGWETLRSRFGITHMKITHACASPWALIVSGATAWFGLWALYGYAVML